MNEIEPQAPVLVTGATGYVAGWIVRSLLARGCSVRATVRDPDNTSKVGHLHRLAAELPGQLELRRADLLHDGAFDDPMDGCGHVFHTASPFILRFDDPHKDLVEPALSGTRNVLQSANRCGTVQRVVVTSSCAAIYGDNADLAATGRAAFTEEDWNKTSSLDHQPYSYSKTLAEREAWSIAGEQDRWRLVAINPSLVLGPGLKAEATSGTHDLFRQFGDGTLKTGVPDYRIGAVDVRDVAKAHLRSAFGESASGRYIVSGHDTSFPEIAAILAERWGNDYPIPRRTLPKSLIWLVGPIIDRTLSRRVIARNVGVPFHADNTRSVDELEMQYRPLHESVIGLFEQMIEAGAFR